MIVVLALLALQAAEPTAPAGAAVPAQPDAAQKKICRREANTGSIMRKRVCRTRAEWDAIAARDAQNVERLAADRERSGLRPEQ